MATAVRSRPCVIVATILLASCGSASLTTPTTEAVTTTTTPEPLTPADVDAAIGTPDELQGRSAALAGDYALAATKEIPNADATALFVDATGVVQAFSRRMTMNYIDRNDPMSFHRARGIMRVIVFDTSTNASVAVRKQGNSFSPIGTPEAEKTSFVTDEAGSRKAARWHVRVGGDLPCLHEGLSQYGRVVAWMVVRNKNCGGWVETTPAGLADDVARALITSHPRFAR